jgi:hypothetical protein
VDVHPFLEESDRDFRARRAALEETVRRLNGHRVEGLAVVLVERC